MTELEAALSTRLGAVRRLSSLGAGTATRTYRCDVADGTTLFVKAGASRLAADMLDAEADGLSALNNTRTIRVPSIVARGEGWIAMEYFETGNASTSAWRSLGHELAALHRVSSTLSGWHRANYIGTISQRNSPESSWSEFWRSQRLRPLIQLESVAACMDAQVQARLDALCAGLDEALAAGNAEDTSLLHGDLWNGNALMLRDGGGAVIDPSCYNGHREVDLAMAALFGGFSDAFFASYNESFPLLPGWERRRAIYQVYYLLAHVAMFGSGYMSGVVRALGEAGY